MNAKSLTVLALLALMLTAASCTNEATRFDDSSVADVPSEDDGGDTGTDTGTDTDTDIDTDIVAEDDTNVTDIDATEDLVDTDQDGILDLNDNCDDFINQDQADNDQDGEGDECDTDDDNDTTLDVDDEFPFDDTRTSDSDDDGLADNEDNCTAVANVDQDDLDLDGVGDECDVDVDGDGYETDADAFPTDATEWSDPDGDLIGDNTDNCDDTINEDQADSDADLIGDVCDDDVDGDAVTDTGDNCPETSNTDQADLDGDTTGDACDDDADGDTYTIDAGDCDDGDAAIYPGITELFDLVDNDCDGITDTDVSLSLASATFTSNVAQDQFGKVVASAGDVNGDGYDDILVAAPLNDDAGSAAGKVYLFYGSASMTSLTTDATSSISYTGENPSDRAGTAIAGLGDINGDSYDDFAIGAYQNDGGGSNSGKVYIIYGAASLSSTSLVSADVTIKGEDPSDYLGYALASAGDVNGDGLPDIIIGAYGDDAGGSSAGRVYLIYGSTSLSSSITLTSMATTTGLSFVGENAGDTVGKVLNSGHDLDGDGYSDITIAATQNDAGGTNAGKVYVVYGSDGLADSSSSGSIDLSAADAAFTGEAGDYAGFATTAGDFNGDGFGDIAIGAYRNSDGGTYAGKVSILDGSATRFSGEASTSTASHYMVGSAAQDNFGYALASGDLNADGIADLLIGAPENDDVAAGAGKAYLWLGSTTATSGQIELSAANGTVLGEAKDDSAGFSLDIVGDVNGDGFGDNIIGAYRNDDGASNAGKVYLNYIP